MVIKPVFVDTIPEKLEPKVLYISIRFRTASHLCASGCGEKVVTPIRPLRWALIYNGDSVSLSPSIGNFQLPCKSHYYIRRNNIVWISGFRSAPSFFSRLFTMFRGWPLNH